MRKYNGNPRQVVSYQGCPDCSNWSCGVQANGRLVRHSEGFGSVERLPKGSRLIASPICKGSGKRVGRNIKERDA